MNAAQIQFFRVGLAMSEPDIEALVRANVNIRQLAMLSQDMMRRLGVSTVGAMLIDSETFRNYVAGFAELTARASPQAAFEMDLAETKIVRKFRLTLKPRFRDYLPDTTEVEAGVILVDSHLRALAGLADQCEQWAIKRLAAGPDPYGLTVDEMAALRLYSQTAVHGMRGSFYSEHNAVFRFREEIMPHLPMACLISRALAKLPVMSGVAYRGLSQFDNADTRLVVNNTITWAALASSSVDPEVARGFSSRFYFTLNFCNGRNINEYSVIPSESEILIPYNSRWHITRVENSPGAVRVTMTQNPADATQAPLFNPVAEPLAVALRDLSLKAFIAGEASDPIHVFNMFADKHTPVERAKLQA
jgi:hypothetical protein